MSDKSLAWYRHPMMWLVIFPPLASVLAGIITLTLIIKHPDPDVRMQPTVTHSKVPPSNSVVPPAE